MCNKDNIKYNNINSAVSETQPRFYADFGEFLSPIDEINQ